MKIKQIFDEIGAESSTKQKIEILGKYKDNELLKRVLYLCNSKRVKFYIKQIPEYNRLETHTHTLEAALECLSLLSERKVTGHEAILHLKETLSCCEDDDAYIIERIIEKDCKMGMGTTFINKVFPKLIEDTPYMGAKPFSEKLAKDIFTNSNDPAYSQVKMDGRYANAIIRGGDVEMESRQGEPTILDGAIVIKELERFNDSVLNGELTMDGFTRYESNGIIASLIDISGKRGDRTEAETAAKVSKFKKKHGLSVEEALEKVRFTVWDVISVDEYFNQKSNTPYYTRLVNLGTLIDSTNPTMISKVVTRECETYEDAMLHFQELLEVGQEGTILKDFNGLWKDGKPNWQVKMKLEMEIDLKIVGFNYGEKGSKNEHVISSVTCESSCGKLSTRAHGITEEIMEYITENQENLLGTIVEVKCNGLSSNKNGGHSVLYPNLKKFRDDKTEADSFEAIVGIEAMAKGLVIK